LIPGDVVTRYEPDDLPEERTEQRRFRYLDAQVGEFEMAVHGPQPYGITITVATTI
jgi:hypothetical protein